MRSACQHSGVCLPPCYIRQYVSSIESIFKPAIWTTSMSPCICVPRCVYSTLHTVMFLCRTVASILINVSAFLCVSELYRVYITRVFHCVYMFSRLSVPPCLYSAGSLFHSVCTLLSLFHSICIYCLSFIVSVFSCVSPPSCLYSPVSLLHRVCILLCLSSIVSVFSCVSPPSCLYSPVSLLHRVCILLCLSSIVSVFSCVSPPSCLYSPVSLLHRVCILCGIF